MDASEPVPGGISVRGDSAQVIFHNQSPMGFIIDISILCLEGRLKVLLPGDRAIDLEIHQSRGMIECIREGESIAASDGSAAGDGSRGNFTYRVIGEAPPLAGQ